jgi:hypothetical protein
MSDAWVNAWVFMGIFAFILWTIFWWRVGAGTYRWDAYHEGVCKGRESENDEAYTAGFEDGVRNACKERPLPTQLKRPGEGAPRTRVRKPRG